MFSRMDIAVGKIQPAASLSFGPPDIHFSYSCPVCRCYMNEGAMHDVIQLSNLFVDKYSVLYVP